MFLTASRQPSPFTILGCLAQAPAASPIEPTMTSAEIRMPPPTATCAPAPSTRSPALSLTICNGHGDHAGRKDRWRKLRWLAAGEDRHARLARVLGGVHRFVGVPDQRVGVLVRLVGEEDA